MTTYVLVSGAWLGGWCWQPVAEQLRAIGHDVYPVTPTGLGERSHLTSPEVDVDTYIADIINVIEYEDLHDVVLIGHSYAGLLITAVTDRIPERIVLLAYLDSGPVPDGTAYLDQQPPPARQLIERLVEQDGEGWRIPMPSWEELEGVMGASLQGLGSDERSRMRRRAVAQPLRTWTQPVSLRNPAREQVPKLLIACSFPLTQVREMIASEHPWFAEMAGPQWSFLELPTGHWPMFSTPGRLAELLGDVQPARRPA
jgi:pimeloyl-ACP methyl ester carboxylesterase